MLTLFLLFFGLTTLSSGKGLRDGCWLKGLGSMAADRWGRCWGMAADYRACLVDGCTQQGKLWGMAEDEQLPQEDSTLAVLLNPPNRNTTLPDTYLIIPYVKNIPEASRCLHAIRCIAPAKQALVHPKGPMTEDKYCTRFHAVDAHKPIHRPNWYDGDWRNVQKQAVG